MKKLTTKFDTFLNESKEITYLENQKILRKYIKLLKKKLDSDIHIKYFTVIHNFLYLEHKYFDLVKMNNKDLNKHLVLSKNATIQEIKDIFNELYDPYNKVRFSVETLDSIKEVDQLIKSTRSDKKIDLYDKVLNTKQMKKL